MEFEFSAVEESLIEQAPSRQTQLELIDERNKSMLKAHEDLS